MSHITLIVKVTRLCNLRCLYCYDWRSGPEQRMPFRVAARMTAAALTDPTHDAVTFLWHGGEPTLLPIQYFEKIMAVQARFQRPGQIVVNSIHTNATNLTEDWISFFHRYRWQTGISIDGPADIHDRYRVDAAGRPTLSRALRGYDLLVREGLGVGVIAVVDRQALSRGPKYLFDFMVEQRIDDYGINFAMPDPQPDAAPRTPVDHYITTEERSEYLKGLYDCWRDHNDMSINIREISGIRQRLARKAGPLSCTLAGNCFGIIYTVDPNGDVGHCCYLTPDETYQWGNIMRQDFAEVRASPNMVFALDGRAHDIDELQTCPEFDVCQGGCPMEMYMSARHDPQPLHTCCGQQDFISHVRANPAPDRRSARSTELNLV
jgi:uncharacterized protein